jgi:hypothetical protein
MVKTRRDGRVAASDGPSAGTPTSPASKKRKRIESQLQIDMNLDPETPVQGSTVKKARKRRRESDTPDLPSAKTTPLPSSIKSKRKSISGKVTPVIDKGNKKEEEDQTSQLAFTEQLHGDSSVPAIKDDIVVEIPRNGELNPRHKRFDSEEPLIEVPVIDRQVTPDTGDEMTDDEAPEEVNTQAAEKKAKRAARDAAKAVDM